MISLFQITHRDEFQITHDIPLCTSISMFNITNLHPDASIVIRTYWIQHHSFAGCRDNVWISKSINDDINFVVQGITMGVKHKKLAGIDIWPVSRLENVRASSLILYKIFRNINVS